MRKILKKIVGAFKPLMRFLFSIFFDEKYLKGRHFDLGFEGYLWALRAIWIRNVLRLAAPMPWPVALTCNISNTNNIFFHPDNIDNFQSPGCYYQNFKGNIYLGHGTYVAPNVGFITANHKFDNLDEHEEGRDIVIGKRCWIGMNSVILPGVMLGEGTIVAAGAVVSKSFPEGHVVIGGIPAKVLKVIKPKDTQLT